MCDHGATGLANLGCTGILRCPQTDYQMHATRSMRSGRSILNEMLNFSAEQICREIHRLECETRGNTGKPEIHADGIASRVLQPALESSAFIVFFESCLDDLGTPLQFWGAIPWASIFDSNQLDPYVFLILKKKENQQKNQVFWMFFCEKWFFLDVSFWLSFWLSFWFLLAIIFGFKVMVCLPVFGFKEKYV